jgi:hypothetical protein
MLSPSFDLCIGMTHVPAGRPVVMRPDSFGWIYGLSGKDLLAKSVVRMWTRSGGTLPDHQHFAEHSLTLRSVILVAVGSVACFAANDLAVTL